MATYWTNRGRFEIANLAAAAQDLRVLLVDTAPASQAIASDYNFISDLPAGIELVATNYARKTLAGETILEDDTNDRAALDATDPATWTALGGVANDTIVGAWVYRFVTVDTDSPLWVFLGLSPTIPTNGGDVTLAFHANGISTIT